MGKKGNWFTALKKAFTSSSPKEKPPNVHQLVAQYPSSHGHGRDKKRWGGFGRSRPHAEPASPAAGALINIPLYREPSSIEKILGDAEMDQQRQYYAATRAQHQIAPARPAAAVAVAASAASAAAPLPRPVAGTARERERSRGDKPASVVLPLPPPSPPPLIRRFDHDREQQQKLEQLQMPPQSRAETEWRQQQQQPPRRHRAARQRAAPPDRARAAAVAIQAAFRGYMASAAELPVAARADPAAGRDARRQRAAADGAGDAVHADAGPRSGAGARQPRGGHGAAQPAAPRRHAQGRRQVALRLTGRWHLGRQPADAGGGGRPDEAEGGGRDQARESPRLCLLPSAAEGDTDGGPRDPGGPAVGPEPLVVDAHRAPPRAGGLPPCGARQHQASAGDARHRPPRDDDDDANGDDPGPVGGVVGLLQDKGHEARDQGGSPAAAVVPQPRGEHPRRREPDELPGVRRRAQLHDADAVGVRQGAGAGAPAAAAAEGSPGEAQVLVRAGPEHRELGQEPVLEGRRRQRAAVVEGGHAGGVGGRRAAPVDAVDRRAQRGLHRVHAGRDRQEALQVDTHTCRPHRCLHCILLSHLLSTHHLCLEFVRT